MRVTHSQLEFRGAPKRQSPATVNFCLDRLMLQGKDTLVLRFGNRQRTFTPQDISVANPALLNAFLDHFKPKSQLLSAHTMDAPVLLREVVSHTPDELVIKDPFKPENTHKIDKKKDMQVLGRIILLNLPLVNHEMDSPEELWRKRFEDIIDQVDMENRRIKRSRLSYHDVDNPYKIYQPCGFTLGGELFVLRNPYFNIEGEPPNDKLKGYPQNILDMFLSFLPEKKRRFYEKPENEPKTWSKMAEWVMVVKPENLRPIYSEGMYERAGYVFIPS